MSEPLLNHLRQVQSRLRQILWLHGLSCVTIVAFGSLLVFSLLDWALRLDDSGVRLILALTTLGGTAWAGWRYLIQPLRKQMTGVGLALRIERRFPELRDQLASTVQFLESGADPRIGSPALQKQQIQATLRQVEGTRLSDVFELRSVQRAGLAAIGVLLVGALLAGSFQSEAATALTRLMFPFSSTQWPRWTELEILNSELQPVTVAELSPLRIARGHTFILYVANRRGAPPSDVRVEFDQPGEGGLVVQPLQHLTRRNKEGQAVELCSLQLSPQERELRFRIAGGDDRTPWLRAVAVPPPRLEGLRVTLTPPAYTGRPVEKLPEGAGHIQALTGTTVEVTARSTRPLGSARLRLKDEPAQLLQLAPAAQQIAARFTITEPGLYAWWLELTDLDGFEDADAPRFEILAVPDTVPQVFIEQPQTDLNVTANAVIPVEVTARDDIGLRQVRLPYRTGSRGGLLSDPTGQPLKEVILFDAAVPGPDELSTKGGQPTDQPPGEQRQPTLPLERIAAHQWNLEQLQLEPGMQLSFHAEATDDCDLGEPHIGRSAARLLTVVSSDDKVRELLAGQAGLLDDLEQILQSQQKARESVDSLLIQLREAGELRTEDRDLLKQVEIDQRAIASRLMTPTASVHARVRRLIEELERNRLEEPDLAQRLSQLNTELTQLGETRLPSITGNITTARKLMQSAPPSPPSPTERTPAEGKPADGKPGTEKPDTGTPDTETPGAENPATGTSRTESAPEKSGSQTAPAVQPPAQNPPEESDTPGPARAPETPGTLSPETLKKQDPPPANTPGKPAPSANDPQAGSAGSPQPEADSDQPETIPQQMLARVESEQELVVESLRAMVNRLSRWQNQADLERELAELKGGQEKLNRESAELGSRTLARPLAMLTPQERADLQKLADRQSRQTEKLQQLERRIGQAADALEDRDELLADRLRSVRDMARDLVADGEIPQAAESLSRNETGQATRLQQSISRRMQNLQDALENRGISDTETLLGQLRQAENELEQLRKKQEELLRKTDPEAEGRTPEEREQQLEQLHREQEQLKSEARQLARRLTRLRAWQAGDTLRRSSASMDRAAGQLESPPEEDQLEQLRRKVEETQQEALDDLDQARRELARTREQVQEVLEQEAIEKVAEHIRGMIGRQQQVIEETERLEGLRAARGNWSRAQLKSLRDLADVQEGLQSETAQLAEQAESAAVFSLALKGAARLMQQAAALLRDRQTGPSTVAIEQRAKQRFEQLASVLDEQPENGQPPAGEAEQQEQDPETGRPPQDSISLRAEVRLLQALQQSLLERTTALDAQRVDGELPPAQQQELDNVVEEQAALVELAAQLIARFRRSLGGDEEAGSRQPEEAPAEEGRPPRSEPEPRSQTEPQLPESSAPARTDLEADQPEPAGTPSS